MGLEVFDTSKTYLTIIGGTLTQKVDESTQGAKKRIYETSDGKKGEKWELSYKSVNGFITGLEFKDSEFGEQLALVIEDGEDKFQLQMGLDSKYFTDFAKKLSNIYLDDTVTLAPYDFEAEGKRRTGISIKQEGEKIEDFFWDGKKNVNGLPLPEGDTKKYKSDDWKVYFITVKKFLKAHVENVWSAKPAPQPVTASDDLDF